MARKRPPSDPTEALSAAPGDLKALRAIACLDQALQDLITLNRDDLARVLRYLKSKKWAVDPRDLLLVDALEQWLKD